jgi:hypothetical protein
MKNFKITWENISNKPYVPVFQRESIISSDNVISAALALIRTQGNFKHIKIVNVEEVKEDTAECETDSTPANA